MTRISTLFVASTLAILPLSAFAETAKPTEPTGMNATGMSTTTPSTQVNPGKAAPSTTADSDKNVKSDGKTPAAKSKDELHGMNTANPHKSKAAAPAKAAEPSKS